MKTVYDLINDVLAKEGGYINHPADKGGPTKYGITLDTLEAWRTRPVSPRDVELLTRDEAHDIYYHTYFAGPGIAKLPPILQPLVFDMAVNHGPDRAIKLLQEVVEKMGRTVEADGIIGPITVAACNIAVNVYGADVVRQLVERRQAFYRKICERDPSQNVFLTGWLNRAQSFLA